MRIQLKKISDQTIVITGATSGIGLVTARLAASRGANLLLIARNEDALDRIAKELDPAGKKTIWAVADVADRSALEEAAAKVIAQFGQIDTWINNAGVSIYGRGHCRRSDSHGGSAAASGYLRRCGIKADLQHQ